MFFSCEILLLLEGELYPQFDQILFLTPKLLNSALAASHSILDSSTLSHADRFVQPRKIFQELRVNPQRPFPLSHSRHFEPIR